jgi:hypothetical protein
MPVLAIIATSALHAPFQLHAPHSTEILQNVIPIAMPQTPTNFTTHQRFLTRGERIARVIHQVGKIVQSFLVFENL